MGRLIWPANDGPVGRLRPYVAAVLLVGAATLLGAMAKHVVTPTNLVMLYLLAVVICGLWWGRNAAVLASLLGVVAFDYFFVPPHFSFAVSDAEYLITFAALLLVALVIGTLTGRLRDHTAVLHQREQETAALYSFSKSMAAAQDITGIAKAVITHVTNTFERPAALVLHEKGRSGSHTIHFGVGLTPNEETAALQGLTNGQTCSEEQRFDCLPLKTSHGTMGVLVLRCEGETPTLHPDQTRLLQAFVAQAAIVVERAQLDVAAQEAQFLIEAEKLHDALLHSISHALRTPLASIIGSLSTLMEQSGSDLDPATQRDLVETAREEAERLNWLVSNLLDMTRLESGHLRLLVDWYDMEDVVGVVLSQTASSLKAHPVHFDLAPDLPLIPMDQVLIVQVLDNLFHNAAKYSPPGSPIDVVVRTSDEVVTISVSDLGVGIPEPELERVFEKFYRVDYGSNVRGTGLGLAICKGIVEAHHGRIWADRRPGGGTTFTFTLPLQNGDVEMGGYM
jgi:two-component system sensor histidine kinase KdpD